MKCTTQMAAAVFAALDQFEADIRAYGLEADRGQSRAYKGGPAWLAPVAVTGSPQRGTVYQVPLFSKALPVRGNKALIDKLERGGLTVRRDYTGEEGRTFRAYRQALIFAGEE